MIFGTLRIIPANYTDNNTTYSKMRSLKLGETYLKHITGWHKTSQTIF